MGKIKVISNIKKWAKNNRTEFILLLVILSIGAFLRLYRIGEYMTFLGDEGRDVIVVRRLLVNFDPILVGPGTSIGNMYLGPIYYYMIAPFLWLFNYSPVGPSVMVALFSVATIFLTWFVAREWFGKVAAFVAALFYVVSPTTIIFSKSSWNPNIMPFFALVAVYFLWKAWQDDAPKWLMVSVLSFSICLQSHYLAFLLVPVMGVYWLKIYFKNDSKKERKNLIKYSLAALGIFVIFLFPLVVFDARHGWRNAQAMYEFFSKRQTTVSARPWRAIPKIPELLTGIFSRIVGARVESAGKWILAAMVIPFLLFFKNRKKLKKYEKSGFVMIFFWIGFALVGLGSYKQNIYDHYYGFIFSAPFLLIGGFVERMVGALNKKGKIIIALILSLLLYINLANSPLLSPPNRQLQRSIIVAERIEELAKGEKFNFAVVAERNYESAYWYFLEKNNAPIVGIDAQRMEETLTDQLFVVCEKPREECQPTSNPKAEIANFGWSRIEEEWEVSGVRLYKLVHVYEL